MARSFIAALAALLLTTIATSALEETTLKPGVPAPVWKNLPGVDGKTHSLDDLKSSKIVVVAFMANSCPYAVAYEDRLIEFAKAYEPKGVAVVFISVNPQEEDRLPAMKVRAKEKAFPFPYLHDQSRKIGREYGAAVTPHAFVVGPDRKVAYAGAFDNARKIERVSEHYVRDVVEALLAGKEPAVKETHHRLPHSV